jgi:hypothetical protein
MDFVIILVTACIVEVLAWVITYFVQIVACILLILAVMAALKAWRII